MLCRRSIGIVCLVYEHVPIWILCIYPLDVTNIFIPQVKYFSELHQGISTTSVPVELFNAQILCLGQRKFVFNDSTQDNNCLYLILGSLSFNQKQYSLLSKKKDIFITDVHHNYWRLPLCSMDFQRLIHNHHGGASIFSILYHTTYPCGLDKSDLVRNTSHFIDHSLWTKVASNL